MGISIRSNVDSLRVQTKLGRTSDELSRSFERLSSGLRITGPADDPAGLALAEGLAAQARIASVAIRNTNDGLSMTSVADGALTEVNSILSRMLELATQSANGIYTNSQRSALSFEFLALGSEVDRISQTTRFNNIDLLSNSSSITLQVGFDSSSNSQITVSATRSTLDSLGLAATGSNRMTFSIISTSEAGSTNAAATALSAVRNAIDSLSSVRGAIGAAQSRLGHAINVLQVARENYIAAESKIRDVDVAEEIANMVRLQVLQQATVAVLAQANLTPQTALDLLK